MSPQLFRERRLSSPKKSRTWVESLGTLGESVVVEPMRASVETLVAADLVHTAKIATSKRTVKILLQRVTDMNYALKDIRADVILVRAEQGVRLAASRGSGKAKTAADNVLDYILPMDDDDEEGKVTTPRKSGGKKSPISISPSNSQSSDEDEASILAKLIDDVKTLQSGELNNTIKFGGLGIADVQIV